MAESPTLTEAVGGGEPGVDAVEPEPQRRFWTRVLHDRGYHRALSVLSIILVLGSWQVCAVTGVVDERFTSSPWGVVQAAQTLIANGTLGGEIAASAELFAVGWAIAIIVGLVGGIVIGWWRVAAALLEPWVAILYAMPLVAVLPLILLWFGITFRAEVIMVTIIAVFPVVVSVLTGTRQVDTDLIAMARSFGAKRLHILRTIVLPSVIPYFVAGVRLAIGAGLIGVVVAEYFMGEKGIGGLIVLAGEDLKAGEVLLGITILALASIIMTTLLRWAERKVTRWRSD